MDISEYMKKNTEKINLKLTRSLKGALAVIGRDAKLLADCWMKYSKEDRQKAILNMFRMVSAVAAYDDVDLNALAEKEFAEPQYGYHKRVIPRGTYGEVSKIREELWELVDAHEQKNDLMMLQEIADIWGAIQGYLGKHRQTNIREFVWGFDGKVSGNPFNFITLLLSDELDDYRLKTLILYLKGMIILYGFNEIDLDKMVTATARAFACGDRVAHGDRR